MTDAHANLSAENIASYLRSQEEKSFLRFLTCGSVDDGKSTLIGRLLYDTKLIFLDQLATLEKDSRRFGTADGKLDFALLVDGLEAEREQGITIDVAYRFFATEKRKFIVADTPGHEEYTRNMATGASTADLAVVVIDARRGVLSQTRRHTFIASLLGIQHIVLAVNKIDLVNFAKPVFDRIVEDYRSFAVGLGFKTILPVPISALNGDNVTTLSKGTPWYKGPTLLHFLETVEISNNEESKQFRFPVQLVSRPDLDFRGFSGQVASGRIRVGDAVVVAKSGQLSKVSKIVSYDGNLDEARAGQAITIVVEDQIDVSRGNMLVDPQARPHIADQLQAHVVWFDAEPMIPGRSYILRTETESVNCAVTILKHEININTFAQEAAKSLHMNSVGVCNFSCRSSIAFDSYRVNRVTGNFIIIDRYTNRTLGAGMIDFPLRRAENVHWQAMEVNKRSRAEIKHQRPAVLWFTGLSGSGKSTIANCVEKILHVHGKHTYILDGDNVRHGLNRDLGFTDEDRVENIRRVAETAKLMSDAGLIVIVSFISPFRAERRFARELMDDGEFIEIFVDTPIEECARRDPKGLYKKAEAGTLKNFTGISSPYERPENPELHILTLGHEPYELAERIVDFLAGHRPE